MRRRQLPIYHDSSLSFYPIQFIHVRITCYAMVTPVMEILYIPFSSILEAPKYLGRTLSSYCIAIPANMTAVYRAAFDAAVWDRDSIHPLQVWDSHF